MLLSPPAQQKSWWMILRKAGPNGTTKYSVQGDESQGKGLQVLQGLGQVLPIDFGGRVSCLVPGSQKASSQYLQDALVNIFLSNTNSDQETNLPSKYIADSSVVTVVKGKPGSTSFFFVTLGITFDLCCITVSSSKMGIIGPTS